MTSLEIRKAMDMLSTSKVFVLFRRCVVLLKKYSKVCQTRHPSNQVCRSTIVFALRKIYPKRLGTLQSCYRTFKRRVADFEKPSRPPLAQENLQKCDLTMVAANRTLDRLSFTTRLGPRYQDDKGLVVAGGSATGTMSTSAGLGEV